MIGILFAAGLTVIGLLFTMMTVKKEDRKTMSPEEEALYEARIRKDNVKRIVDAQIQNQMGNGPEPVSILLRKGL